MRELVVCFTDRGVFCVSSIEDLPRLGSCGAVVAFPMTVCLVLLRSYFRGTAGTMFRAPPNGLSFPPMTGCK